MGFDDQTEAEAKWFARQMELARDFNLPVLVHTPHRDKKQGTIRTIELIRSLKFPEERVLIDHNNEETLPLVLNTGCWAGHSIYPQHQDGRGAHGGARQEVRHRADDREQRRRLGHQRSAEGAQDDRRDARARHSRGDASTKSCGRTRSTFFSQSGQFDVADLEEPPVVDRTQLFEANSVLRGERAPHTCTRPRSSTSSGSPNPCSGTDTPHLNALRRDGASAPVRGVLPAVTCSGAGHVPDRPAAPRARRRRQRVVLPRPRAGDVLAPGESARARREGVGHRPPPRPVVHLRADVLVVQHVRAASTGR